MQIFLYAIAQQPDMTHFVGEALQVLFYIGSTHLLRFIVIKNGWLALNWVKLIPRLLLIIFGLSVFNYAFLLGYSLLSNELTVRDFLPLTIVLNVFGPMIIYFIWAMIYFTFHYFERYNKSLKYEAAAKEIELRNLRSQLNPHFIFNALNSIRALVDENPVKSKNAITQLSNILRNSLTIDRQRMVTLSEELAMVKDYLALESIRYEERLHTEFDIDPESMRHLIPPLMIQTLVENGIKHGIATLKTGGIIKVSSEVNEDSLIIQIRNTGQYLNGQLASNTGFGLSNTKKRLELIYGDQATFLINNESKNTVLTQISVPKSL
ncbi:sensor histidine kinase [Marinoscillum furvescens]|uniref:sensor histidine kinase n=1 Tax=Marinoscillum furvescens TaxID=1026 RepID=UPI001FEB5893|nr:histidine kinase [Marinoscillum furvescens]